MKTKEETDKEILESAKETDSKTSQINIRDTNSEHPLDCHCIIHRVVKFDKALSSKEEGRRKKELDFYES